MALLEICGVTKSFGDFTAVNNVNITIEAGEFFTLLGPSGCGKTTLLRMIAGFDLPDSGQILLDGINIFSIPPEKRPIHTVFQSYALFPHMTVAENVAFPLKMVGKMTSEISSRVKEFLDKVRLSGLADLAHQFINFMLDGKNSAELTNLIGSGNPNMDAIKFIEPDIISNSAVFPDEKLFAQLEMLQDFDQNQRRLLNRLWTEIKLR